MRMPGSHRVHGAIAAGVLTASIWGFFGHRFAPSTQSTLQVAGLVTPVKARPIARQTDIWQPLKGAVLLLLMALAIQGVLIYGLVVSPLRATVKEQEERLAEQDRRVGEQEKKLAEQERKLAPRTLRGKTVPAETLERMAARPIRAPVSVVATSVNQETLAFAMDLWVALPQVGLAVSEYGPDQSVGMATGAAGVQIVSLDDSPDDPLHVFGEWLRREGFDVSFGKQLGANAIVVSPKATE